MLTIGRLGTAERQREKVRDERRYGRPELAHSIRNRPSPLTPHLITQTRMHTIGWLGRAEREREKVRDERRYGQPERFRSLRDALQRTLLSGVSVRPPCHRREVSCTAVIKSQRYQKPPPSVPASGVKVFRMTKPKTVLIALDATTIRAAACAIPFSAHFGGSL